MPQQRNCLAQSRAGESGEETSAQQAPRTENDPNPVVMAPWLDPEETYGD